MPASLVVVLLVILACCVAMVALFVAAWRRTLAEVDASGLVYRMRCERCGAEFDLAPRDFARLGMRRARSTTRTRAKGVAYFDLIFEDGSFDRMALSAEYAALNPDENGEYADWRQAVAVDAGGRIYKEERGEPAEGLETVPADALFAALRQLGGLDWASALGTMPEELLLSSGPEELTAGGAAWVFTDGELVPADGYEGSGGLFALIVYGSAGEQRIFLDI